MVGDALTWIKWSVAQDFHWELDLPNKVTSGSRSRDSAGGDKCSSTRGMEAERFTTQAHPMKNMVAKAKPRYTHLDMLLTPLL